jgi:hypothetical protein
LDNTIYKKQDKYNKRHNTICVGNHYIQETRQIQQNTQHNMCWTPLFTRNKTNTTKTQHNMCWTPLYTRNKTKTNTTKTQHNMCWTPLYTRNKTNTTKNTYCVVFLLYLSCFLYIVVSNTYCVVCFVVFVLFLVYSGFQHILCCVSCCICLVSYI